MRDVCWFPFLVFGLSLLGGSASTSRDWLHGWRSI
jgi:hypothetical protein